MIPTWEPYALFPDGDRPERWAAYGEPDLAGRFIVLHLGNLGFGHRTDTIADVAAALADEDVTFLFVGGGERYPSSPKRPRAATSRTFASAGTFRRSRPPPSWRAPTARSSHWTTDRSAS